MLKMKIMSFTLFIGLFIFIGNISNVYAKQIADAEVISIANKLVNAVLQKNEDALIKLSRPEDIYEGKLAPNTREFIFGISNGSSKTTMLSVYQILHNAKDIKYLIEKSHGTWNGRKHEFVRIYFYDPAQIKLELPLDEKCGNYWMKKFVTCLLVKVDGKWIVAYSLFDDETEGPLGD